MAAPHDEDRLDEGLESDSDELGVAPVGISIVRSTYDDLTIKTERLEKRYQQAFQVSMSDFEQLHHKISECCERYDVRAVTVAVTVYHVNDTSEVFNSFDRFRQYNRSNTNPVQSVVLTYNLLILLPNNRTSQSYEITVRVVSAIAAKAAEVKLPGTVVDVIGGVTGVISIKYVDYLVAHNLCLAVEGWFEALSADEPPRWLKFARNHSQVIVPITEYSMALFVLWLALRMLDTQLPAGSANLPRLAQIILIGVAVLFASDRFGHFIGVKILHAINSLRELGYVSLNRGDAKEVAIVKKANHWTILKALGTFAVEFITAIAAHIAALAFGH